MKIALRILELVTFAAYMAGLAAAVWFLEIALG